MPSPTIAIYGALDRFNYGDLLFPLILRNAILQRSPEQRVEAIGLRRSGQSSVGALPTHSLRWLKDPDHLADGSSVILAGGEMLAADWTRLASHLLPKPFGDTLFSLAQKLISEATLEQLARKWLGAEWRIPFAPQPQHFDNQVRIIFNAVGGSQLEQRPEAWQTEVKAAIAAASFASVRDQDSLNALGGEKSPAELHPDSAATMALQFDPGELRSKASGAARTILDSGAPFLCFQLHRYFTQKKLEAFAKELDKVHHLHGLRIVLLPIGRATGHSDQVSLEKVRQAMSSDADLPTKIGVFDIMALLAHCSAYTGTSLHGLISAMAFARPYAILGKNPKCLAFAQSWALPELRAPMTAKNFCEDLGQRLSIDEAMLDGGGIELAQRAQKGLTKVVEAALEGT